MADIAVTPVIIGTAGHVDHGKSALVLRMTGTDPDRLPQEKARGITIDLGFAELALPSGRVVGVVDVPGHSHYVRAMVAGATGVDVALLVVAADDGVMPQTREHVRILQLLGVRQMAVALTKCDLVDEEMAELAAEDVRDFLSSTVFAGAAVIKVSSKTGQGVDELLQALDGLVSDFVSSGEVDRRLARPARMPIDRAFNVAGVGTVVTGTAYAGTFSAGDEVEIIPARVHAKVRSVQVHGDVPRAMAGQRTALGLPGVTLEQAARGSTVCAPGSLHECDRFDCELSWLGREDAAQPLESGERVHVCAGTSQALGRLLLFDGEQALPAGGSSLAQIRLEEPLALRAHDRFVVMSYSPVELVGGGEVLWTRPPRRTSLSQAARAMLDDIASHDDAAASVEYVRASRFPLACGEVAGALDMNASDAAAALDAAVHAGTLARIAAGEEAQAFYIAPATLAESVSTLVEALSRMGSEDPALEGVPALALRDATFPRLRDDAFMALAQHALDRGAIARFGANLIDTSLLARAGEHEADLRRRMAQALKQGGVGVGFVDELARDAGLDVGQALRGLRGLVERGEAEEFGRMYYLDAESAQKAREIIARAIKDGGGAATVSQIREALGITRKYAVPLLEHLDKAGFTRRDAADSSMRGLG